MSGMNAFTDSLLRWYDSARRDLPWRASSNPLRNVDPYAVLVSEFMLQQTQVATVIPYFQRFMAKFPTVSALAAADEQDVLRLWQGLGYYSRARHLHHAAQMITGAMTGQIPRSVDELLRLPGVGRYTAGAIASIAFGVAAPILDGNVARVLCRLYNIQADPRATETRNRLWKLAEEILPDQRLGDFNSALMELGATICTAKAPKCLFCPVVQACQAYAAGTQLRVPAPRRTRPTPLHRRWTFCIQQDGRWLIEQRPAAGRWAGMWQFITRKPAGDKPTPRFVQRQLGLHVSPLQLLCQIRHALTHRRYVFDVFIAEVRSSETTAAAANAVDKLPRRWITLQSIVDFPLSRPQARIAEALGERRGC